MVQSCRGTSLLNIGYKIYAAVLNKRLKKDIEKKAILPETQARFKKNRSAIDDIYVLQQM